MFDDDEDDNPIGLLVLGVLAAVLSVIIWQFIQDDGSVIDKYSSAAVAEPAVEPTAIPPTPAPTAVPEPVEEEAVPVPLLPIEVTATLVGGGAGVILEGVLPSEDLRGALVSEAETIYGPGNVEDRLILDPAVGQPAGLNVTLRGSADSDEQADQLRELMLVGQPGVTVDDGIEVAPPPEPTPEPVDLAASLNELFQLEPIQFDSGSSRIRSESDPTIDQAAELLLANPDGAVTVEGHTDSKGGSSSNQRLSQRRADAVREALIDRGVEADRLEAVGFGEDEPVADNDTPDGRQLNRRIEFSIDE